MFFEWVHRYRVWVCLWIGAMVASVGVVAFPRLADVSAMILYGQNRYNIEKTYYSYKPGQSGMYLTFKYSDEENGKVVQKEANLLFVFLTCAGVYGLAALLLWYPVIFVFRKLKKAKE